VPIVLVKAQTVGDFQAPAGALIFGLPPAVEAAMAQGGDANVLGPADASVQCVVRTTQAALPATGVTGVLYEITDGPARGQQWRWTIPEGESQPAWCFGFYPARV
jgi:hypothetical protein